MQAGALNAYGCVKAFSETDISEDLKKFDFPTLVLHGEDDQIVPVKDSAKKAAKLINVAKEIYYLSGRVARRHGHASGSGECRSAPVPQRCSESGRNVGPVASVIAWRTGAARCRSLSFAQIERSREFSQKVSPVRVDQGEQADALVLAPKVSHRQGGLVRRRLTSLRL